METDNPPTLAEIPSDREAETETPEDVDPPLLEDVDPPEDAPPSPDEDESPASDEDVLATSTLIESLPVSLDDPRFTSMTSLPLSVPRPSASISISELRSVLALPPI